MEPAFLGVKNVWVRFRSEDTLYSNEDKCYRPCISIHASLYGIPLLNERAQGTFHSSADFYFESQQGIHNMENSFLRRGDHRHRALKWLIPTLTTIWAVIYGVIHEKEKVYF